MQHHMADSVWNDPPIALHSGRPGGFDSINRNGPFGVNPAGGRYGSYRGRGGRF